jgi:hypothetical protein
LQIAGLLEGELDGELQSRESKEYPRVNKGRETADALNKCNLSADALYLRG